MARIFDLPIKQLDQPSDYNMVHSQCLHWHQKNDGILSSEFTQLQAHISICASDCDYGKAPKLLNIGPQSSAREAWGDEWADDVHHINRTPNAELEEISANGYLKAYSNGYHYDLIEASDGLTYERLTFAIRNPRFEKPILLGYIPLILGHRC